MKILHKKKLSQIAQQLKKSVTEKYDIVDFKIFGSHARGDFKKYSDIDIFIKLPSVNRDIEEDIYDIAYDIELANDCLIDVIVVSENQKMNIPLFINIEQEGISI